MRSDIEESHARRVGAVEVLPDRPHAKLGENVGDRRTDLDFGFPIGACLDLNDRRGGDAGEGSV